MSRMDVVFVFRSEEQQLRDRVNELLRREDIRSRIETVLGKDTPRT
jgi:hypothetical protein